jgi:hypothetical protein
MKSPISLIQLKNIVASAHTMKLPLADIPADDAVTLICRSLGTTRVAIVKRALLLPAGILTIGSTLAASSSTASDTFTPGATFRATCDRNAVNITINNGSDFWMVAFSGPNGVALRQGAFEGATRWPFNSPTPGLSISGRGRGCNTLGGRFQIHDIDLQNNRVNRFHASFVQRCDNSTGLLTGDIRVLNMAPSSSSVSCQR